MEKTCNSEKYGKLVWNESLGHWEQENGKRICTVDNETLDVVLDNCKEFLKYRDIIYLDDVCVLLEKSLEYVADKNDLSDSDKESIKRIRKMIKGL